MERKKVTWTKKKLNWNKFLKKCKEEKWAKKGPVVETEIGSSGRLHNLSLLSFGKEGNYTSFTYFSLWNLFFFRLNHDYKMWRNEGAIMMLAKYTDALLIAITRAHSCDF